MKSFTEEYNIGTIEILKTSALTNWDIILGKFLAALVLVCLAILPTIVYVFSVWQLANPEGNVDFGSILGSYLGLLCLAISYITIGMFTSSMHNNQIFAFILSVTITFLLLYGFDALGELTNSYYIKRLGINEHFKSISRGVIDTRDVLYFISVSVLFLFLTKTRLQHDKAF